MVRRESLGGAVVAPASGGQIALGLHRRHASAITNFDATMPTADAERALQATKVPYVFDFLELADSAHERELEQALIDDIQRFLLELGAGFAFYGRQVPLLVGDEEFFVDLLFYHHTLKRFVVIELKVGKFRPEYAGKLHFYLNAVDEQLRIGDDAESVGIILCAERNDPVAARALHRIYFPIAVATWQNQRPALPAGESEKDLDELDRVRARLQDRVERRANELHDA